jgi:fatty acid desaturase
MRVTNRQNKRKQSRQNRRVRSFTVGAAGLWTFLIWYGTMPLLPLLIGTALTMLVMYGITKAIDRIFAD